MSQALREALALVEATIPLDVPRLESAPLPSLMERVGAEAASAPEPPPIRLLHHLACTGGTLISRAISVMPNVTLLNEIDPLSTIGLPGRGEKPAFRPQDLLFGGLVALRPVSQEEAVQIFRTGLSALHAILSAGGRHLVLRDHSHSHFCTGVEPGSRPTLSAIVSGCAPVRAVVTVRHPMESFLSLRTRRWVHYKPDTIEAYAQRYHAFLDAHAGVPVLRYEDIVADPEPRLEELCQLLDLPFRGNVDARLRLPQLSGNSGRTGHHISPRPPKPVPEDLQAEARKSRAWSALLERLGYDLASTVME